LGLAVRCRQHALPTDAQVKHQKCAHDGCGTNPSFGTPGTGRGGARWCRAHAPPGAVGLLSKRCEHVGCDKKASFGDPTVGRSGAKWCATHRAPGTANVMYSGCGERVTAPRKLTPSKTCTHGDCFVVASFHDPKAPGQRWCKRHAPARAVSCVIRKPCAHAGCDVMPSFAVPDAHNGVGRLWCKRHAPAGAVSAASRRCVHDGCFLTASFGDGEVLQPGRSRRAKWCKAHAAAGAVNVVALVCQYPGCGLCASYGASGALTWCKAHAGPGDVTLRRCAQAGCATRAWWGVMGQKPTHCAFHADKTSMVRFPTGSRRPRRPAFHPTHTADEVEAARVLVALCGCK
jgi:hypothetical protein